MPVKIKQGSVPKPKISLTGLNVARRMLRIPNTKRFVMAEKDIVAQIKTARKEKNSLHVLRFEDLLLTSLLKRKADVREVKACLEQMMEDAQKGNHSAELRLATERYDDLEFILKRFGYKKN
jgi:hypothetical protein